MKVQAISGDSWTRHFSEGDQVRHIGEPDSRGTIYSVDYDSYPWHQYGITTASVIWEGDNVHNLTCSNLYKAV